jgi:hypothetical protein
MSWASEFPRIRRPTTATVTFSLADRQPSRPGYSKTSDLQSMRHQERLSNVGHPHVLGETGKACLVRQNKTGEDCLPMGEDCLPGRPLSSGRRCVFWAAMSMRSLPNMRTSEKMRFLNKLRALLKRRPQQAPKTGDQETGDQGCLLGHGKAVFPVIPASSVVPR